MLADLLDLVDQAVLLCDEAGALRWCNAPARALFPGLRLGAVLPGPSRRTVPEGVGHGEVEIDGRRMSGHRVVMRCPEDGAACQVWLVRDDSAVRAREAALLAERSRSAFLAEAGRHLGASLHPGRTVRAVVRAAVPTLADTAVVVLPARGPRADWHSYGPDQASGRLPAAELERTPLLAQALRGLLAHAVRCGRREVAGLGDALPPGPDAGRVLVVTLPGAGAPSGVLVLARGPQRPVFGPADTDLAREFAARAGIALAAAAFFAEQVHTAAVLQDGLVPDPLPHVAGVCLAASYRPAGEALRIGGDFYQVRAGDDGGVEFVFGDVCGKGVEAAVLAGRVRQSLRSLALVESRPVRVLHLLNEALLADGATLFTTLVTGSARPAQDGALDVVVAGGGHLPPLVLRENGRVEEVHIGGTLVGALPDADFDQAAVRLAAGELMLLYSDGVTEARGGPTEHEMYGGQRLMRDLATCAGMPAGAVSERVDLLLGQWLAGRSHDDVAVLVVQAPAGASVEAVGAAGGRAS